MPGNPVRTDRHTTPIGGAGKDSGKKIVLIAEPLVVEPQHHPASSCKVDGQDKLVAGIGAAPGTVRGDVVAPCIGTVCSGDLNTSGTRGVCLPGASEGSLFEVLKKYGGLGIIAVPVTDAVPVAVRIRLIRRYDPVPFVVDTVALLRIGGSTGGSSEGE